MKYALFVAAGLLTSVPAFAALTTLDFNSAVDTDITNDYTGLNFIAPLSGSGPVRTWAYFGAGNNVLGLNMRYDINQGEEGAIDIKFAAPVNFVSIRSMFSYGSDDAFRTGGLPFMAVYNSPTIDVANRLGLVTWDIAGDPCLTGASSFCLSAWDTLDFASGSDNIFAIRISASAPGQNLYPRRGTFDDLIYGTRDGGGGGGGGGGGEVPEPASALLLGLGLLGIRLVQRRTTMPAYFKNGNQSSRSS